MFVSQISYVCVSDQLCLCLKSVMFVSQISYVCVSDQLCLCLRSVMFVSQISYVCVSDRRRKETEVGSETHTAEEAQGTGGSV